MGSDDEIQTVILPASMACTFMGCETNLYYVWPTCQALKFDTLWYRQESVLTEKRKALKESRNQSLLLWPITIRGSTENRATFGRLLVNDLPR